VDAVPTSEGQQEQGVMESQQVAAAHPKIGFYVLTTRCYSLPCVLGLGYICYPRATPSEALSGEINRKHLRAGKHLALKVPTKHQNRQ